MTCANCGRPLDEHVVIWGGMSGFAIVTYAESMERWKRLPHEPWQKPPPPTFSLCPTSFFRPAESNVPGM